MKVPIFYEKIFFWRNWNSIQFNKMLLAEPEKYIVAINAIKKDVAYMPIELRKKLEEENIFLWMNCKLHSSWLLIFKN